MKYEVVVGNIGTVYSATDSPESDQRYGRSVEADDALDVYGTYKSLSKGNYGRAAGEPVTLLRDGEIWFEYEPKETYETGG